MPRLVNDPSPDVRDYLGDGVYAIFDGCGIWLHANDVDNPTDRIYLEPEVVVALERFVARIRAAMPAEMIQVGKKEP